MQITTGQHLIIDVDYLNDPSVEAVQGIERPFNRQYMLAEIPTQINLFLDTFVIVGVVVFTPGHYVAYTRGTKGNWKLFNDLSTSAMNVTDQTKVTPHLLLYIKI